jgi:hypothetical protein
VPFVDPDVAREYREAWEAWLKQIEHVHRVFLDGEPAKPDAIKGLLNREARTRERYEAARNRLLGIEESPPGGGGNPFRRS